MVKLRKEEEKLVIAAIGESGEGKSTLLNLLLGSPGERSPSVFDVSEEPEACTRRPQSSEGHWRGDQTRPVVVVDTPGVGCEDGVEVDREHLYQTAKLLETLGHVNAFVVVIKSGQSRFLSQHQAMFDTFQEMFGDKFWRNVVIDVSHVCNGRQKKNFDSWIEKLAKKFPGVTKAATPKVFIDSPIMINDTLEDFYNICKNMDKIKCSDFPILANNEQPVQNKHNDYFTSLEDISFSSDSRSDVFLSTSLEDRPMSSLDIPNRTLSRSSFSTSTGHLDVPYSNQRPVSRSDLTLPTMPHLPPRSPTTITTTTTRSRRRTLPHSIAPSQSLTSTPHISRSSFLPSPTDNYSSQTYKTLSKLSSSPTYSSRRSHRATSSSPSRWRDSSPSYSRLGYYSSRETSPVLRSRDPSPDTSSTKYPTIGLPTYLRTSYAHKYPFTKAMRSNRLLLSHATEDRVLLEVADPPIPPLPRRESLDKIARVNEGQDLISLPKTCLHFDPMDEEFTQFSPTEMFQVSQSKEDHRHFNVANIETDILEIDNVDDLTVEPAPDIEKAIKKTEPKLELETYSPETMIAKNPYMMIKKALLPKIKYHWDSGFKQGPGGWAKVPVVKLKIKYPEEDQELLPPSLSVEGGRWCETKLVRLETGRAKVKLRTCGDGSGEGSALLLRVVPIDREGKQEIWVPEFLITIDRGAVPGPGEKWLKTTATPAMPE